MQDGTMVFGDLHLEDGFVERIDYKTPHMVSDIAIPGLVDIHTHGFHGYSCENTEIENLHALALEYPKRGITSFCPTVSARSLDEFRTIINAYRKAFQGDYRGARYEGVHLEGPYLNPERRGSMKTENLMEIHLGELEDFLSEYHDDIKIMTIAPDVKNAMEAICICMVLKSRLDIRMQILRRPTKRLHAGQHRLHIWGIPCRKSHIASLV